MMDMPLFQPEKSAPITVSQLNQRIKFVLEDEFGTIQVIGEISSFTRHSSGHLYFELKDAGGRISAVMFRGRAARLRFSPSEGLEVQVTGKVSVYAPQGKYQLVVDSMKVVGLGDLEVQFRRLKERLQKEGLFDTGYKKQLPFLPKKVGVATAATGAAVRDILKVIRRRNPLLEVVVRSCRVQGEGAAQEIIQAIEDLDSRGDLDAIIVGRGGGSYEDLFVFNDEGLARTLFALETPVISAVGHEVDFTIADFVADIRAATPTDAAQIVTPDIREIIATLAEHRLRLMRSADRLIAERREMLRALSRSLKALGPVGMLETLSQKVDDLHTRLHILAQKKYHTSEALVVSYTERLKALSPLLVLNRGYSIVKKDGKVLETASGATEGDHIEIVMSKGTLGAQVEWTKTEKK